MAAKKKKLSEEQKRRIFCVKNGHSRLLDAFFGYHYCARCREQLGDSIGGAYSNKDAVYVSHMNSFAKGKPIKGCPCPENAKKLAKVDFTLTPQWNSWGIEQRPPWRTKPDARALADPAKQAALGEKEGGK